MNSKRWEFMINFNICVWNINGVHNKFLNDDVTDLIHGNDIIIIVESHFGVRTKCPENHILIARSTPRVSKKAHAGVALFKRIDSKISFNVVSNNLYDMLAVEIRNTSAMIIATYIPPNNTKYYDDIYFDNLRLVVDNFRLSKTLLIVGDLNSRIKNNFPYNNFQYYDIPNQIYNQNGRHLIKILNEFKELIVINGIQYKRRTMDSKFTFFRGPRSSQIDLAICNNIDVIHSFIIHEKLPQSDQCPCLIKIQLPSYPPLDRVNECSIGFRRHDHYDLSKRIKKIINIKQLDLISLENNLAKFGDDIWKRYQNIHPSQEAIDNFSNDLSKGLYDCLVKSKIRYVKNVRIPTQTNCNSDNFKAIANTYYKRYLDLVGINYELDKFHKEEWLFYQGQ